MLVLGGCLADGNERIVIGVDEPGGGVRLESVGNASARPEAPVVPDTARRVTLNRADWRPTTVLVPVDGTYGHPTYAQHFGVTDETARQRGDPVTPLSALDGGGNTERTQLYEAAASPWRAVRDLIMMPVRMVRTQPWERVRHIPRSYWRTPAGVATNASEPARGTGAGP